MATPVIHKSFTIERTYPQAPARVFSAFRDPVKKRRWFAEGEGFVVERLRARFSRRGLRALSLSVRAVRG